MTSLESQRLSSVVGELHVLSAHLSCLTSAETGFKAVLRPNPVFLPKVLSSSHANQPLIITAFHPPPHSSQESRELHTLFPVRALIACLAATRTAQSNRTAFFVCYGENIKWRAVSKQRLAHWITNAGSKSFATAGRLIPDAFYSDRSRGYIKGVTVNIFDIKHLNQIV
jgi:hypothetical protein